MGRYTAYPSRVAQQTAEVERLHMISFQVVEDSSGNKGLTHSRRSVKYNPGPIHS